MDAIVVGVIAVLIGALLCFRGYVTMRLIISLFGAFVGFLLGAGLVAGVTDSGFGQLALSWLVGIIGAVIFGVLAYFSYQVAVVIGLAGDRLHHRDQRDGRGRASAPRRPRSPSAWWPVRCWP